MSEPKFSIGQPVAVCSIAAAPCTCGNDVIPATTITGVDYIAYPTCACRTVHAEGWYYEVAEHPGVFFAEYEIRLIKPDEYTEPLITSREVSA